MVTMVETGKAHFFIEDNPVLTLFRLSFYGRSWTGGEGGWGIKRPPPFFKEL